MYRAWWKIPLVLTNSKERIYSKTASNQNTTSMLPQIVAEIHHLRFSDNVWHNDPEVSTQSKSDPAGILQQGHTQLRKLCVNHPRVVAAIQTRAGRKQSSMPNFLTPTQTHNRLPWPGAGPHGTVSHVNGDGNLLCSSELEKYVYIPVVGQQNEF